MRRVLSTMMTVALWAVATTTWAFGPEDVVAGQHYARVNETVVQDASVQSIRAEDEGAAVQVLEFFSYGCHWCYSLDPLLHARMAQFQEDADVAFRRVPVVFQPSWRPLAKAYYTLEALEEHATLHPLLFETVQRNPRTMASDDDIRRFFLDQGVEAATFDGIYGSFSMTHALERGNKLMQVHRVMAVPLFVISTPSGVYTTNALVVPEPTEMLTVIETLVEKGLADA